MEFSAKVARSEGYADGWEDALWNYSRRAAHMAPHYPDEAERSAYWNGYQLGFECGRVRRLEAPHRSGRDDRFDRDERE